MSHLVLTISIELEKYLDTIINPDKTLRKKVIQSKSAPETDHNSNKARPDSKPDQNYFKTEPDCQESKKRPVIL